MNRRTVLRSPVRDASRSHEAATSSLLLTVSEATIVLNLSRTRIFELMKSGEIPRVKVGRTTRICRADLDRYVATLRQNVI